MRETSQLPDPSARCESRTRRAGHLWRCRRELGHEPRHECHGRRWADDEAETTHKKRLPRHDGLCRVCGQEPRSPATNNGLGAACLREHRRRYTKAARDPEHLVYRRWTQEELDRLRAEWGRYPPRVIVARMGRSYEALRVMAHVLGLSTGRRGAYPHMHGNDFGCTCLVNSHKKHWTPGEVATLEVRYSRGDSLDAIARALRRTRYAVRAKVASLQIRRDKNDDVAA